MTARFTRNFDQEQPDPQPAPKSRIRKPLRRANHRLRRNACLLALAAAAMLVRAPRACAQDAGSTKANTAPQVSERPLRAEVDLQSLEVQVRDAQGRDVQGLTADDFTILENGKPQKIAFFDAGNDPASLVVLVDSSGSVNSNGRLGSAQSIAAQFMRTARPGDDIAAMDFNDQMGPFQQLTAEQLQNPSAEPLTAAAKGGSALYDAVATALCHLRSSKNLQQAVVVITDGIDQHSRLELEQLVDLVRSSRAQLFMVGLQSRPEFNFGGHAEPKLTLVSGHDIDNPVVVFDRLMKESGAESSILNSQRGLADALKAVSNTLRAQYTLAYYPTQRSKKLRKIAVEVDRQGVTALTRQFLSPNEDVAESVHFDDLTCTVSPKFHPYPYESKVSHSGNNIYREDFSDAHSGWPNHENSHYIPGGYQLSNPRVSNVDTFRTGQLSKDHPGTSFSENVIAAYGPWWKDFSASVTMSASFQADSRNDPQFPYASRPAAGLVFRLNQSGYYAALLSGATGAKELWVKLVKREFQSDTYRETEIFPWTHAAGHPSATGTQVAVQGVGDQITVFVDSQELKTAQDDSFSQGYAGFVVSGPGSATFKNLVVEQK